MEKILKWWTQFLVELEAGKRVIAIFIVISFSLTYALIRSNSKLDTANNNAIKSEKLHGEEIARGKDSSRIEILRLTTYYNEKTENIYKQRIDALNEIERGYKIIKKTNDKIISKVIK